MSILSDMQWDFEDLELAEMLYEEQYGDEEEDNALLRQSSRCKGKFL